MTSLASFASSSVMSRNMTAAGGVDKAHGRAGESRHAAQEHVASPGIVYVVDDDASMRDALSSLLRSAGFEAETFASPEAFLRLRRDDIPGCLVLDVRLHGASGFSLQETLAKEGLSVPIIFITAHGDVEMSVRAMKAGAMDFLVKPFRDQDMLDAVARTLAFDRARLTRHLALRQARARYEQLTPRENDVVQHVLLGKLNKQIAAALHLSEITVKIHRGRAMRKMEVGSVAELVRVVDALRALDAPGTDEAARPL